MADGREAGEPHLMLTAAYAQGRIERAQGRVEAAFQTYTRGLEFADSVGSGPLLSTAVAHEGLAEVLYERNQLELAQQHARESVALGRQLTSTQALATGLATSAWIRQALGDPAGP